MNEKELKKLVDSAVLLHREISTKTEQLKALKADLIEQARLNPEALVSTQGGGKRWTAKGNDGCIARVNFPAPSLVSEIEAETDFAKKLQAIAGEKFRRLFNSVRIFQPTEDFRTQAAALLPASKAETLVQLCENESSPRVSFETAKSTQQAEALE